MVDRADPQRTTDFQAVLLAMAGHDLRQPLQIIQSSHELLGIGVRTKSEQNLLQRGQHAIDRLIGQFDQLLGAARLYEHSKEAKLSPVALEPLFRQAYHENEESALQKGIDLLVCPTGASVMSNAVLLNGILRNLVSNAIKYTEPKGRVLIGCRRSGQNVRIDVCDTGIGITSEQLSRIFEAFTRLDSTRCDGLGVGLFIVRRAIEVLGHRIDVSSVASRGSRFSITQREPTRGATSSRPSGGKEHWNDDPEKEHYMNFIMSDKPKRARMKVLLALLRAAALSCGLIIGLAPLCLAEAELNRQDPSLDAPSSRRPGAARGALISAQPLNTAAALPSAARNFLVLYNSRSPDDSDVVVSGTVSIPAGNPPAGGWPLITWTHGTTGLAPQCAPSSDTVDGPEHTYLSATQAMLDAFVRHGYVVVATDYQGFGGAGVQAYLVGMGEARSAIDIMRAARKVDLAVGTRYVVMGHSQGGQADLFTAAIGPDYAPEFTLLGNVAMAPASHIGELVQEAVIGSHPSPILPFLTYMLQSYAAYYPEIALERILKPRALEHLSDTLDGCIDDTLAAGYWAESIPSHQFVTQPDLSPLLKAAAANEPGQLRIVAPTLLIQGTSDRTIPPKNTDSVARDLCRVGNSVSYRTYPDASHEGVLDVARSDIEAWVNARFAGLEATSNCDEPPSAAASR